MKKLRTVISASILSADFANLQAECQNVLEAGCDSLHVDIMDGHFVNNLTIGPPIVSCLRKKLPQAHLDVHLMVTHPENYLQALAKSKINCFIFHYQAHYSNLRQFIQKIKSYQIQAGVSVKPGTALENNLIELIRQGLVNKILIMTVQPGFGGQKFLENTMPKVKQLRQQFANLDIQVDGGLTEQTAKIAASNGANWIVSGTSIFGQKDRRDAIQKIRQNTENNLNKLIQ